MPKTTEDIIIEECSLDDWYKKKWYSEDEIKEVLQNVAISHCECDETSRLIWRD